MRTCIIYGHGGLDLDVAFNVLEFYKQLGYQTCLSSSLFDADIIVVLRPMDKPIDVEWLDYQCIHIYDYVGNDYEELFQSLNHAKTSIFCTSQARKERIISSVDFPEAQIHLHAPPVVPELWMNPLKGTSQEFVHIGHFKKRDDDPACLAFNRLITEIKAKVWGLGWEQATPPIETNGKAGLFEVSGIYSRSQVALGIMYPFQRTCTFSGRFWQAPLNGCALFSEKGLFTSEIPGVYETEHSLEVTKATFQSLPTSEEIQKEAERFWRQKNTELVETIKKLSCRCKATSIKHSFSNRLRFYKGCLITRLRIVYQKRRLFRFF